MGDNVETEFDIKKVNWSVVLDRINELYYKELAEYFKSINESGCDLILETCVSDLIFLGEWCSDEPVKEIERPDGVFGRMATQLSVDLQKLLVNEFGVPKVCAQHVFLRNLPHPKRAGDVNIERSCRIFCDKEADICTMICN